MGVGEWGMARKISSSRVLDAFPEGEAPSAPSPAEARPAAAPLFPVDTVAVRGYSRAKLVARESEMAETGSERKARWLGLAVLLLAALTLLPARVATAAEDWNDSGIAWQPYEQGLAAAKKSKKPICLIFYTELCPHCQHYSGVFHDPKVVEEAKKFVMIRIRLSKGQNADLSAKYDLDGQYIPRTIFLSSDGKVDPSIHAPRDRFKYFYDEMHPKSVLGGMNEALSRLH
jgi:protein-disulfide reductase (glutathione)